jgi:hypothetical protein
MMRQMINRVDHVVWIVRPENAQAHVDRLSALYGVTFDGPVVREPLGCCFWVSWEAGLEIFTPHGDGPYAAGWNKRLEERGEGVLSVIVGVRDINAARENARRLGYEPSEIIGLAGDEPYVHKLETMKEVIATDMLGTYMSFGEIKYAEGVIITA